MQVNSISMNTTFKASPEEQAFVKLNDDDLKWMAYKKASFDVNDKKHHKIDKALYYSLPLAAGVAAATKKYAPEFVKAVGTKNIRAFRLGTFGVAAASWTLGLAAINLVWNAKDAIANSNKKVKEFVKNNPIISTTATLVAGLAAVVAANRFGLKGITKAVEMADKKGLTGKILEQAKVVRNALNSNKILNKTSELLTKVPSPIKDMARGVAEFAPLLVIGTQIGHSFGHQAVKAQVVNKNYNELKQAKEIIKENIADEQIDAKLKEKLCAVENEL